MRRLLIPTTLAVAAFVLAAATAGCSDSMVTTGFTDSARGDSWNARFRAWEGSESIDLGVEGRRSLELRYEIEVEDGSVTLSLQEPDGDSVWNLAVNDEAQGSEEIPLAEEGDYSLVAFGTEATGRFEVSWRKR